MKKKISKRVITCPICKGQKIVDCVICGDIPLEPCNYCDQRGVIQDLNQNKVLCPVCEGCGYKNLNSNCFFCKGQGVTVCYGCLGEGVIIEKKEEK